MVVYIGYVCFDYPTAVCVSLTKKDCENFLKSQEYNYYNIVKETFDKNNIIDLLSD